MDARGKEEHKLVAMKHEGILHCVRKHQHDARRKDPKQKGLQEQCWDNQHEHFGTRAVMHNCDVKKTLSPTTCGCSAARCREGKESLTKTSNA